MMNRDEIIWIKSNWSPARRRRDSSLIQELGPTTIIAPIICGRKTLKIALFDDQKFSLIYARTVVNYIADTELSSLRAQMAADDTGINSTWLVTEIMQLAYGCNVNRIAVLYGIGSVVNYDVECRLCLCTVTGPPVIIKSRLSSLFRLTEREKLYGFVII